MGGIVNADGTTFFEAAAQGRLVVQRCKACGHVQFPPRHLCEHCWAERPEDIDASGRGVIEAATIVRRSPAAVFRDRVPYVVASIRIEEGPRMITNVIGDDALKAAIGDSVKVMFAAVPTGEIMPHFVRVQTA